MQVSRRTGCALAWLAASVVAGIPAGAPARPLQAVQPDLGPAPVSEPPRSAGTAPRPDFGPAPVPARPRPDRATPRSGAAGAEATPPGPDTSVRTPRPLPPAAPTILDPNVQPIDLNTALRLAGVQNPDLLLARQRVVEADAFRILAAAQALPSINPGTNYDTHTGVLQQSNGNILSVNRSAVYVGAGSNAVAAGTVNIPGVLLTGNVGQGIFAYLTSRQVVRQREFATVAVRNQVFLAAAVGYAELLRAEGHRAVADQARTEAREVARLTEEYAATGFGRQADANRAAAELAEREAAVQAAEGEVIVASARLAQVLNLDPSIRLHPTDAYVVPHPIVPSPMPLIQLIALALLQRPELAERRTAIREAFLALQGAKVLPFSPTIFLGYSAGGFGGGSNLVRPIFGGFGGRTDFDAVAFWTIQNCGVGNIALIRLANAELQARRFQELAVLNLVREEVASAFARTHARFAQITTTEEAVRRGAAAFREDYERIQARAERDVLPIELLNSFRLLARSRFDYLDAIVDYDRAQFELYVALGQPPANCLAHPVLASGVTVPGEARPPGEPGPSDSNASTPAPSPPPDAGEPGPFTPGRSGANAEPKPARGPSGPGAGASAPAANRP